MIRWLKKLGRSFRYAFAGLAWLITTQRNAKIHLSAALVAVALGAWLGIGGTEWSLVALSCGMVVSAEALNSAIEKLADRITTEKDECVRVAKDVAAAGVLIASVVALIVGLIVFLPRLLGKL